VIVFGLGNPGEEYLMSRHNIGFMVADALAMDLGLRFRVSGEALVARASRGGEGLVIVKPLSYMNRVGRVLKEVLAKRNDSFLVVTDDVDLVLGCFRLRKKGGAGGHNGLASIIEHLGTEEFARLRVGIGPRPDGAELSDYVLAPFSSDEKEVLGEIIAEARDAVTLVFNQGMDAAMNKVNAT